LMLVTSKIVHSQVWSQFSALMDVTTSHGWLLWTLMQILLKGHPCFGWFIMYVSFLRHSLNLNVWKLIVGHWYNHIVNICSSVQTTASWSITQGQNSSCLCWKWQKHTSTFVHLPQQLHEP
jgi:hypothetical protein